MTNYERIKSMTKEEMVEFLLEVKEDTEYFNDDFCWHKCEYRDKTSAIKSNLVFGKCIYPDGGYYNCPYSGDEETIKKWLEVEV